MTPSRTPTVPRRAVLAVGPGAGEFESLLCELPADAATAHRRLHHCLQQLLGPRVSIVIDPEHRVDPDSPAGAAPGHSPDPVDQADRVRVGAVSITLPRHETISAALGCRLRQAAAWLALAVERDRAATDAEHSEREATAMGDVVQQLLAVQDLDQVLLSISNRTLRLLDADICGVMLRDNDEVRMRSCVGNRLTDTARLHMRRGQGVAGLVFDTGRPARVDSYLDDRIISKDFMALAEQEQTQSALAVPLMLRGDIIGVLEVWRRRPSVFTDTDVRQMVTLADFATIAIINARLHDEQAASVAQLQQTRDALQRQVTTLGTSSRLQQALLSVVLDSAGLSNVARTAATALQAQVAVYGSDGGQLTGCNATDDADALPAVLPLTAAGSHRLGGLPSEVAIRPVHAAGDQFATVCLLPGPGGSELADIAAGQLAMACSLTLLLEHAAQAARTEALEQVLWDLLKGSPENRRAARSRALQLNVALSGTLRVIYGRIENAEDVAAEMGWDTSQTDRTRRDVLRAVRGVGEGRSLPLVGLRGDHIVAIATDLNRSEAKEIVNAMSSAVHVQWQTLRTTWGISRPHEEVSEAATALNEATTALSAAQRLGGHSVFLYEELGIVRLLLGSGDDPDLQTFIDEVTGPIVRYDTKNQGSLVKTLRAYFDADCSQRLAAERLFIHHKTMKYRLDRIRSLTGLDLARHEDRVRADFALRLLQVNEVDPGDRIQLPLD
jgi:DNA-binding PucR family transcriptional regulator